MSGLNERKPRHGGFLLRCAVTYGLQFPLVLIVTVTVFES
jgi:hypothetical protein